VVDEDLYRLIYMAIHDKHLLRFEYKTKERIVEPHNFGVQKGTVRLLSWQVGGKSSSRIPGWRWFDVVEIRECRMLDQQFAGNREVSGAHHRWDEVFIRVRPPDDSAA
jgi:predicted DNA-binding transcriptional regulator YafY